MDAPDPVFESEPLPEDPGPVPEEETKAGEIVLRPMEQFAPVRSALVASAVEQARALTFARYELALRYPREMAKVKASVEEELKDVQFAAEAIYSKKVGRKQVGKEWVDNYVEGPSIRLAEAIGRSLGHFSSDAAVIEESPLERTVMVTVCDYQTGNVRSQSFIVKKTVERSKGGIRGRVILSSRQNSKGEITYTVEATEDELQNKQGAQAAKIKRNLTVEVVPRHLLNGFMALARKNAKKQKPRTLFEAFASVGVSREELVKAFALPEDPAKIDAAKREVMRKIYVAIRDGEARWSDVVAELLKAAVVTSEAKPTGVQSAAAKVDELLEREPGTEG